MTDRFYKLPVHIAERQDLTASAKLVFAVLWDRVGKNSGCWPSHKRIAQDVGICQMTVLQAVADLVAADLVAVETRGGDTHVYTVRPYAKNSVVQEVRGAQELHEGIGKKFTRTTAKIADEPDELNQTHITRPNNASAGGAAGLFGDEGPEKDRGKPTKQEFVIPEKLAAMPGFLSAWQEWLEYRRDRRLTCTPKTLIKQLGLLAAHPAPLQCIEEAIRSGWQGLFKAKDQL